MVNHNRVNRNQTSDQRTSFNEVISTISKARIEPLTNGWLPMRDSDASFILTKQVWARQDRASRRKISHEPESNQWPMDNFKRRNQYYSPPLYQLSYCEYFNMMGGATGSPPRHALAKFERGAQRWQRWILPLNHWHISIGPNWYYDFRFNNIPIPT